MQILVMYSTVEGHTAKVADFLAKALEAHDNEVFLTRTTDPGYCDPGTFDAAILCAPIHIGNYPSDFTAYVQNWKSSLQSLPTALVTLSLAIASDDPEERAEAHRYPDKLVSATGWQADQCLDVAGALKYLEYDFFKRWMLKRIAAKAGGPVDVSCDHELTDWQALEEFAGGFNARLNEVNAA